MYKNEKNIIEVAKGNRSGRQSQSVVAHKFNLYITFLHIAILHILCIHFILYNTYIIMLFGFLQFSCIFFVILFLHTQFIPVRFSSRSVNQCFIMYVCVCVCSVCRIAFIKCACNKYSHTVCVNNTMTMRYLFLLILPRNLQGNKWYCIIQRSIQIHLEK